MDSALSLLNSLTTSAGLCYHQALEEPVGPVLPSRHPCLRHRLMGAECCDVLLLPPGARVTRKGSGTQMVEDAQAPPHAADRHQRLSQHKHKYIKHIRTHTCLLFPSVAVIAL